MKREIKFRAWDLIECKVILPEAIFSIAPDGSHLQYADQGYLYNNLNSPESHKEYLTRNGIEIRDEFVLMQFTGLHDKNGKEIYEGDVCKVNYYELGLVNGVVKFRVFYSGYYLEGKQFQASMSSWEPDYIEIIGNIYENPDLCNT